MKVNGLKRFIGSKILSVVLVLCVMIGSIRNCSCANKSKSENNHVANENSKTSVVINEDTSQSSGELDFIKSNTKTYDILTDSKLLLYGGIFLIVISAIGVVFVLAPKKKNKKRRFRKKEPVGTVNNRRKVKRGK